MLSALNPLKVVFILEHLAIPYEHKFLPFDEMKKEPFVKINPNGRVPAIQDPYMGITLWESGDDLEKDFPNADAWLKRLHALPGIAKGLKDQEATLATQKK